MKRIFCCVCVQGGILTVEFFSSGILTAEFADPHQSALIQPSSACWSVFISFFMPLDLCWGMFIIHLEEFLLILRNLQLYLCKSVDISPLLSFAWGISPKFPSLFKAKTWFDLKFCGGKRSLEPSGPCNYGIPGAEQQFQPFQLVLGVRNPHCCLGKSSSPIPRIFEVQIWDFWGHPKFGFGLVGGRNSHQLHPKPQKILPQRVNSISTPSLDTFGILKTPEGWKLNTGSGKTPEYSKGSSPS